MILEGKTMDFLGDSITEGVGVSDIPNNRYDNVLKRKCNLKGVHNYGIGGTRIAHQRKPSEKPRHDLCFCGRAYDLNPEADVIVVYGGVNDFFHGDAPIGTPKDSTPATFYGAVEFLMNLLQTTYQDKRIVFLTPAHCCKDDVTDKKPSPRGTKGPDAMPLVDYVNIIVEKGEQHGIPVLNLYENLGIDPNNQADSEAYTIDGLHFNDAGHAILADCLIQFLENLD